MRKQTISLLLLLSLSGVISFFYYCSPPLKKGAHSLQQEESTDPPKQRPYEPLWADKYTKRPAFRESEGNHKEHLLYQHLPKLLDGKEGSYTNLSSLFKSDGTSPTTLRSDWITSYLLPEQTLPSLRMKFSKNPETGEYQPSGGTIAFPRTGLEANYEFNPATDEQKTTLQWKKSF